MDQEHNLILCSLAFNFMWVKAGNTELNYVILHACILHHTHTHTHTHSGVWNVPFISSAILFSGTWLRAHRHDLPTFTSEQWDPDMAFAAWMREKVAYYVCWGNGAGVHCVVCSITPNSECNCVRLPTFCVHSTYLNSSVYLRWLDRPFPMGYKYCQYAYGCHSSQVHPNLFSGLPPPSRVTLCM